MFIRQDYLAILFERLVKCAHLQLRLTGNSMHNWVKWQHEKTHPSRRAASRLCRRRRSIALGSRRCLYRTAVCIALPWCYAVVTGYMWNKIILTPSTPEVPNCCCLKRSWPYWSNPPFLIFDIRALWRSGLSARAPECQKLKMVG